MVYNVTASNINILGRAVFSFIRSTHRFEREGKLGRLTDPRLAGRGWALSIDRHARCRVMHGSSKLGRGMRTEAQPERECKKRALREDEAENKGLQEHVALNIALE